MQKKIREITPRYKPSEKNILNSKEFPLIVQRLYDKEYSETSNNILILTKKELFDNISYRVKNLLSELYNIETKGNEKLLSLLSSYEKQYEIKYKNYLKELSDFVEKNKQNEINGINKEFVEYFRKHCYKTDKYAIHNCNHKNKKGYFIPIYNQTQLKYVFCMECHKIFQSNKFINYCNNCDIDYYSNVLDKSEFDKLMPAAWDNYHCRFMINQKINCKNCNEAFCVDPRYNILKCLRCKNYKSPNNLVNTCSVCKSNYKAEIIIYNPLEKDYLCDLLNNAIIEKNRAHPTKVPCCSNLDITKIQFYHNSNCKGILYLIKYRNRSIICCEKCKQFYYYEKFVWTCPSCGKEFKEGNENLKETKNNIEILKKNYLDDKNFKYMKKKEKSESNVVFHLKNNLDNEKENVNKVNIDLTKKDDAKEENKNVNDVRKRNRKELSMEYRYVHINELIDKKEVTPVSNEKKIELNNRKNVISNNKNEATNANNENNYRKNFSAVNLNNVNNKNQKNKDNNENKSKFEIIHERRNSKIYDINNLKQNCLNSIIRKDSKSESNPNNSISDYKFMNDKNFVYDNKNDSTNDTYKKKLINKKSDEFDKNLKFNNDYLIINREWKYNNMNKNKDNKKDNLMNYNNSKIVDDKQKINSNNNNNKVLSNYFNNNNSSKNIYTNNRVNNLKTNNDNNNSNNNNSNKNNNYQNKIVNIKVNNYANNNNINNFTKVNNNNNNINNIKANYKNNNLINKTPNNNYLNNMKINYKYNKNNNLNNNNDNTIINISNNKRRNNINSNNTPNNINNNINNTKSNFYNNSNKKDNNFNKSKVGFYNVNNADTKISFYDTSKNNNNNFGNSKINFYNSSNNNTKINFYNNDVKKNENSNNNTKINFYNDSNNNTKINFYNAANNNTKINFYNISNNNTKINFYNNTDNNKNSINNFNNTNINFYKNININNINNKNESLIKNISSKYLHGRRGNQNKINIADNTATKEFYRSQEKRITPINIMSRRDNPFNQSTSPRFHLKNNLLKKNNNIDDSRINGRIKENEKSKIKPNKNEDKDNSRIKVNIVLTRKERQEKEKLAKNLKNNEKPNNRKYFSQIEKDTKKDEKPINKYYYPQRDKDSKKEPSIISSNNSNKFESNTSLQKVEMDLGYKNYNFKKEPLKKVDDKEKKEENDDKNSKDGKEEKLNKEEKERLLRQIELAKSELLKNKPDDIIEAKDIDFRKNLPIEDPYLKSHPDLYEKMQKDLKRLIYRSHLPIFDPSCYEIEKKIGEGTYGAIFRVINIKSKKKYAMKKIVTNNLISLKYLKSEFEIAYQNIHPHILNIYGINIKCFDSNTFSLCVLMDLGDKDWDVAIAERLRNGKNYTEQELISIFKQLASALIYLQRDKKIAHRDIKPENVLIFKNTIYKLADFGEAKATKFNNKINTLRGTDIYMSPILYNGLKASKEDVQHNLYKSDVFSLGYTLLYAISLNYDIINELRDLDDIEKIKKILYEKLKPRFSDNFIELILRMINPDEHTRIDFIGLDKLIKDLL